MKPATLPNVNKLRPNKRLTLLILLFSVLASSVHGQRTSKCQFIPYVFDSETGLPIKGATVAVTDIYGMRAVATTNWSGCVPRGMWNIVTGQIYGIDLFKEGYSDVSYQLGTGGGEVLFEKQYLMTPTSVAKSEPIILSSSVESDETNTGNARNSSNTNIRIRISETSAQIDRVAVFGKQSDLCDGTSDDGQELAELVEGELLGIYGVVERQHLNDILKEQQLSMSGLVLEDDAIAKAGCLAGAQGTVLASYGCLKGKAKLQIKLVDCSTSEMYWSATGIDADEFELLDELRSQLRNQD